ncbi:plasmid pRiA4b ORF-3 family protein [Embleya sp. NBC_00896]|uniref:plasmid pRiA4b ORF-3 family protein n=1 Tax=Embleya sp. NBC_00896 TaxID=2975961 RepID=UPI003869A996|nr:plasmid pRiA4b ORF-3 family protein [Embleya sp. NBC_00896]
MSAGSGAWGSVHRIKVTLAGSKPPIWRRLEVSSECTLKRLHAVVQVAFGWEDYHMWAFETEQERYGVADRELGIRSAASKKLDQVAPRVGDRLQYTYDFGDDWVHDVLVEAVARAESGTVYPRCLTGRRAGPPEDSGGIWGYEYLLEILADPSHEEHAERLEWLGLESGDRFDPAAFDVEAINALLGRLPGR